MREDVDKLGHAGELVRVRPGYARNFLFPRGLAAAASRASIQQIEHERRLALARAEKTRKESQGLADALREVSIVITKAAGSEGRLYGSVTASEVAEALTAKGYDIDRRKLSMPEEHIKQCGDYEVSAKLPGGVAASFQLQVVAEEG
ncbi:MAG: 50S ribosomal protein L9 [Polyangiales bacterium]